MGRLPRVGRSGRRASSTWLLLAVLAAAGIVVAGLVGRDALFGPGPTAIHDSSRLPPRIHVCGRDYDGGNAPIARSAWHPEAPFVLVDPAPLAPCAPVVDDPAGICSSGQVICATWTVVFVRVGPDAYLEYELVGGP